ncbi:hypothetical protein MYX06_04485 [Patescibacteria group bacterium AH-259-L05]|nr:hypothetical protein [Patescibacteria group bacterium AH-259-L05]
MLTTSLLVIPHEVRDDTLSLSFRAKHGMTRGRGMTTHTCHSSRTK